MRLDHSNPLEKRISKYALNLRDVNNESNFPLCGVLKDNGSIYIFDIVNFPQIECEKQFELYLSMNCYDYLVKKSEIDIYLL